MSQKMLDCRDFKASVEGRCAGRGLLPSGLVWGCSSLSTRVVSHPLPHVLGPFPDPLQ